ncbi:MAG: hypothetical protein [Podoviridae sp. ctjc_2]|nr:MAG: hypothetical protein [Podoviridae sp. ctjc_2]
MKKQNVPCLPSLNGKVRVSYYSPSFGGLVSTYHYILKELVESTISESLPYPERVQKTNEVRKILSIMKSLITNAHIEITIDEIEITALAVAKIISWRDSLSDIYVVSDSVHWKGQKIK